MVTLCIHKKLRTERVGKPQFPQGNQYLLDNIKARVLTSGHFYLFSAVVLQQHLK
jgi:hypothetical protein